MPDKKAVKILVTGRVHGVGFRSNTHQMATRLGLKGFVRNTGVNEVEVVAEGDEKALQKLIDYIDNSPSNSQVEDTKVNWIPYTGEFPRFTIKYQPR